MTIYEIPFTAQDGSTQTLEPYRGKVMLIVNVASKCSFTVQYAGLEALYQHHESRGFVVLGFPCNQFFHQEPGSDSEIKQFCSLKYDVSFPVFSKIEVNGSGTHPIYRYLKAAAPGSLGTQSIKWNFTKFLVNRDGTAVKRYSFFTKPQALEADIEKWLGDK